MTRYAVKSVSIILGLLLATGCASIGPPTTETQGNRVTADMVVLANSFLNRDAQGLWSIMSKLKLAPLNSIEDVHARFTERDQPFAMPVPMRIRLVACAIAPSGT